MKSALMVLLLLGNVAFSYAQYSKDKITDILTGGSSKAWTAKASAGDRPEKGFTFNKDNSVQVQTAKGPQNEKWALSSADNIRWTITIGNQSYEVIPAYDKSGSQYVKLTHKAGAKPDYELTLNAAK